jgi:hypothetical protein
VDSVVTHARPTSPGCSRRANAASCAVKGISPLPGFYLLSGTDALLVWTRQDCSEAIGSLGRFGSMGWPSRPPSFVLTARSLMQRVPRHRLAACLQCCGLRHRYTGDPRANRQSADMLIPDPVPCRSIRARAISQAHARIFHADFLDEVKVFPSAGELDGEAFRSLWPRLP